MDRSSLLQLIQEQLDPENTGFIGVETFASLVHSHELPLDPAKLDMLVALAQGNDEGQVCYQELVDLMSSKRSSSFKRAIANGQRALPRDVLLDETGLGIYKRFVRYVAYEILPCEMDRRWYFYQHRTCPPPVFMAAVTLTQIIVFLCYGARLNKWVLQTYHPEYMKSPLVYHPGHRARAWRFLTYMFMHVGLEQLGFNALLQLMIGVPLEMVHGILRISFLYLAGVLAGSLTVSITDMRAPLVGGSGGVYALCSAHLANVVMNWAGMRCPYKLLRMVLALVCMSSEVGRAVWLRFSPPLPASGPQPSFMAHLAGAIVGISMGLTILRSYEESLQDQCGWWVLLLSYGTFLLFAVFWNIFAYDLLGAQIPPRPSPPPPAPAPRLIRFPSPRWRGWGVPARDMGTGHPPPACPLGASDRAAPRPGLRPPCPLPPPRPSPVPKGASALLRHRQRPRGARRAPNAPLGREPGQRDPPGSRTPFPGWGPLVAPQDLHFHTEDWCQKRSDLFFYAKININKRKRNLTRRRIWGEPGRNQLRPARLVLAVPSAARPPRPAPAPAALPGWGRGGSPL